MNNKLWTIIGTVGLVLLLLLIAAPMSSAGRPESN